MTVHTHQLTWLCLGILGNWSFNGGFQFYMGKIYIPPDFRSKKMDFVVWYQQSASVLEGCRIN